MTGPAQTSGTNIGSYPNLPRMKKPAIGPARRSVCGRIGYRRMLRVVPFLGSVPWMT